MHLVTLLAAAYAAGHSLAQSTFEPVRPPAVPLAVRSPYLNTWLDAPRDGGERGYLAGQYPRFWTESITGWQGFINVDGKPYNWMGAHPGAALANQTSLNITSTRSIFTANVGGLVELTIMFLSPVYPDDLKRQSITSSYLEISVKSLDGNDHQVQLYADVSAEWASGDKSSVVEWEHNTVDGIAYHKFWREEQDTFNEAADQASWGNWYWATGDHDNLTVQTGSDVNVRGQFLKYGNLTGDIDQDFRPINERWPVFGFSRDLGTVSDSVVKTLFTIGYTQEDAIIFQGQGSEPAPVPSYWTQYYKEPEVVSVFFDDWDHAQKAADAVDMKVSMDSKAAAGDDYSTITSLAVRQTFGALTYTGTEDKVLVWQKEISSNSVVQTVDVIYPTWPFMLYFDPNLIKYTLAPLLENQGSGHYPNKYAMHDLGRYPRALGYPQGDDEPMPLEESSNMILLMLSYAQMTDDVAYLEEHRSLLEQWAEFLIADAKIPADQLSTDDFAGPAANQTNLAIKGIIGLQAMSEMERLMGNTGKQSEYADIASEYLDFWRELGINSNASVPHSTLQYDKPDTYGLLYNIFADKVLGLNFVPDEIYSMQSAFYQTVQSKYGVILDTRARWTKLDWEMFSASVASSETRDWFVSTIAQWINETTSWRPLTDLYDVDDGGFAKGIFFTARPVVGGAFSILAL